MFKFILLVVIVCLSQGVVFASPQKEDGTNKHRKMLDDIEFRQKNTAEKFSVNGPPIAEELRKSVPDSTVSNHAFKPADKLVRKRIVQTIDEAKKLCIVFDKAIENDIQTLVQEFFFGVDDTCSRYRWELALFAEEFENEPAFAQQVAQARLYEERLRSYLTLQDAGRALIEAKVIVKRLDVAAKKGGDVFLDEFNSVGLDRFWHVYRRLRTFESVHEMGFEVSMFTREVNRAGQYTTLFSELVKAKEIEEFDGLFAEALAVAKSLSDSKRKSLDTFFEEYEKHGHKRILDIWHSLNKSVSHVQDDPVWEEKVFHANKCLEVLMQCYRKKMSLDYSVESAKKQGLTLDEYQRAFHREHIRSSTEIVTIVVRKSSKSKLGKLKPLAALINPVVAIPLFEKELTEQLREDVIKPIDKAGKKLEEKGITFGPGVRFEKTLEIGSAETERYFEWASSEMSVGEDAKTNTARKPAFASLKKMLGRFTEGQEIAQLADSMLKAERLIYKKFKASNGWSLNTDDSKNFHFAMKNIEQLRQKMVHDVGGDWGRKVVADYYLAYSNVPGLSKSDQIKIVDKTYHYRKRLGKAKDAASYAKAFKDAYDFKTKAEFYQAIFQEYVDPLNLSDKELKSIGLD